VSEQTPETRLNLRRGFLYTGAGSIGVVVLLFLETMIAVRLVPPEQYGGYMLLIFVVNLFVTVIDFGLKTSITKMVASGDAATQSALIGSAVCLRLLALLVLSAVIWLAQDWLGLLDPTGTSQRYILLLPVMLAVTSLDELLLAILQGLLAYRQIAVAQILRSLLRLVLTGVFLLVFDLSLLGLIHAWNIAGAIAIVYEILAMLSLRRGRLRFDVVREMLTFGLPIYFNRVIWFVFQRINLLLVGWLAGPVSVALFAVASRIPDALMRLSDSFTSVYFPTIAALLARDQREQAANMLNESLRLISFVIGLGALVAVVFGREIVTLLFSTAYVDVGDAFGILMLALHISFILNVLGYTLTAADKPTSSLIADTTRTALNLAGNAVLIPLLNYVGAAVANLLAGHLTQPLVLHLLRRHQIPVILLPYLKQTTLLLLCSLCFWLLQPTDLIIRATLILGYVGLNVLLSTIAFSDLRILLRVSQTKAQPPLKTP